VINCDFQDDSQKLAKYLRNTGLIFTKFSDLVELWVWMINLTFLLRSFTGRCLGNLLIFGAKNVLG